MNHSIISSLIPQENPTKEWRLYLDSPLGEQAPFEAVLERAFAVNDEFILSKREYLQAKEKTQFETRQTQTNGKVTKTFGPQSVLWIRPIYNDTLPAVGWPGVDLAWSTIRWLDNILRQYSYNKNWIDLQKCNVTQVYVLPISSAAIVDRTQPDTTGELSLQRATADGYNEANYYIISIFINLFLGRSC